MLLLKESSSSSSSSSRTTKKYRRRRLFFRVVGVVIRVDKDGVVSLSLSFAAVYTKEQMENNFTGVLFLGAHFFSYNITRTCTQSCEHHTISFLTTRPFERVLARRKNARKRYFGFSAKRERERGGLLSPFFFFLIKVSSSSLERKNFCEEEERGCAS